MASVRMKGVDGRTLRGMPSSSMVRAKPVATAARMLGRLWRPMSALVICNFPAGVWMVTSVSHMVKLALVTKTSAVSSFIEKVTEGTSFAKSTIWS